MVNIHLAPPYLIRKVIPAATRRTLCSRWTPVLGTAVADEDGHWRFTPDPLGEGEHRLSTTVTDVAGNTSGHSPDFVLTVDTTVAPVSDL
ncbi:Ig-like domain-containing protein, partial [Klebsiella pneumoniae]|uniref:Ig-like domain-containing protein n=1 Tax=Klebsiella pneumoniae TaxID=573 RepID=UPI0028705E62